MAELDPREAERLLAAMPPGPQREALQHSLQEYQAAVAAEQTAAAQATTAETRARRLGTAGEVRQQAHVEEARAKAEAARARRAEAEARAAAAEAQAAVEVARLKAASASEQAAQRTEAQRLADEARQARAEAQAAAASEQAAQTAAIRDQALDMGADLQRQVQRVSDPREASRLSRQVTTALQHATRATTPAQAQGALAELQSAQQAIQTAQALSRRQRSAETRQAVSQTLAGGHLVVPQGKEARFIDAVVTIVVAMGAVLWTASRNHSNGSDILWALFWTLLGGVMAVEAKEGSELQYGGAGVAAANASYLALRVVGGIEPTVL